MEENFPWASQRFIRYNPLDNQTASFREDPESDIVQKEYGFGVFYNNQPHYFIPQSVIEKGFQADKYQFYIPGVLKPGALQAIQQTPIANTSELGKQFAEDYKKSGYEDKTGYLIPKQLYDQLGSPDTYKIGFVGQEGVSSSGIQGIGSKDGQPVYVTGASGRENAQSYVFYNPEENKTAIWQSWYEPGEKWYENPLGLAGLALVTGGLAGAFGAPAAAAGGTTGGIVGTPGVSTIFPVAAPVAPTITAIPPMAAGAAGGFGLLEGVTFPSQGLSVPAINSAEVALLPQGTAIAGQGLQVPTLPGLSAMGGGTGLAVGVPGGTVTQLGFVPTGATPVLGDPGSFINNPNVLGNTVFSTDYLAAPGAAAGMSASDALRLANQAKNLLAGGQNPLVPQQQGLPQGGGASQGVDYSGLLSLLQLQARTPGVSSLTAPAQLRQIYQPTLLPNVLSLLG